MMLLSCTRTDYKPNFNFNNFRFLNTHCKYSHVYFVNLIYLISQSVFHSYYYINVFY